MTLLRRYKYTRFQKHQTPGYRRSKIDELISAGGAVFLVSPHSDLPQCGLPRGSAPVFQAKPYSSCSARDGPCQARQQPTFTVEMSSARDHRKRLRSLTRRRLSDQHTICISAVSRAISLTGPHDNRPCRPRWFLGHSSLLPPGLTTR